jgi:AcrR family transcriptional regulator
MGTNEVGLRERTRRAVRAELMEIAVDLFLTQGFEETTVEQIAAAAGLSRRSYFRYFASKDDVFVEVISTLGQDVAAALSARPAGELPWEALRRSFDPLLAMMEDDERMRTVTRMLLEDPALQSSHRYKQDSWQAAMATALEPRLAHDGPDARLRAEALAGAALSCLTTAQVRWVLPDNQTSLDVLLDVVTGAVGDELRIR